MLINSICLCRVFILFPLSRLPANNLGLTFGTRLRTGRKRQKRKIASEPSRAVVWERERGKKCDARIPLGGKGSAVVIGTLLPHQCSPGSNPSVDAM